MPVRRWGLAQVLASFMLAGAVAMVAANLGSPGGATARSGGGAGPSMAAIRGRQTPVLAGDTATRFCLLLLQQSARNSPTARDVRAVRQVTDAALLPLPDDGDATELSLEDFNQRLLGYPRQALSDTRVQVSMTQHEQLAGRSCYCFRFLRGDAGGATCPAEVLIYVDEQSSLPIACQVRGTAGQSETAPLEEWCLRGRAGREAPLAEILAPAATSRPAAVSAGH